MENAWFVIALKEILDEAKSVLCVIASGGLWTIFYPFQLALVLFINEISSLVIHVRFGAVIPYICGKVYETLLHFGQNH